MTRSSFELFDHTDFSGSTYTYSQLLNAGNNSQVGLAKSFKVYPGDKVKIEAYAKYYNPQSTTSNLAGFAGALTAAFGVSGASTGEALKAFNGLNSYGGIIGAGGGGGGSSYPKAFVNILLFDKDYNFLDIAFEQINGGEQIGASPKAAHDYMSREYTVKEVGYAFMYISNESPTNVETYFDDVVMSYTPSNIVQYNEYYAHSMPNANSWTRENITGNNFLGNGGTELNATTGLMDLDYRNFDPVLGRMNGVDPMADKYASLTPYNFAFNDPVYFNDPSGAEPPTGGSAKQYYTSVMNDMFGSSWRDRGLILDAGNRNGGGSFYKIGSGGSQWKMNDAGTAANALRNGEMTLEEYAALFGSTISDQNDIRLLLSNGEITISGNKIVIDKAVLTGVPNPDRDFGGTLWTGTFVITKTIKLDSKLKPRVQLAGDWADWAGMLLDVSDDMAKGIRSNYRSLQAESNAYRLGLNYGKEINKFKKASSYLKWTGRVLGAYNAYDINKQYRKGQMSTSFMLMEQGTNLFSVTGGIYGASWGLGWEIGRWITSLDSYQNWKYEHF